MNRLIIVGAGGHGKVVADNALKNGYSDICFIDDNATGDCVGFPIIGKCSDLEKMNDRNTEFVMGIGNNETRKRFAEKHNVKWATLIHPSARLAVNVSVGEGTVVMAGVVVNPCAAIGNHCIINTNSVVEHDNKIENYVHISPGVALGGTVSVGECAHIGIGATVINNVCVCSRCIIGAGAVVVNPIVESGTYVGVPAKRIK